MTLDHPTEQPINETILIRVTGIDGPGITTSILHILDEVGAVVYDMEQVVVRQRLNLSILIGLVGGRSPLKDLLYLGWERDLHLDFEVMTDVQSTPSQHRCAVTVIAQELPPRALAGVTDAIVKAGGNIDRISRLSKYPVMSYELEVVGAEITRLREELLQAASVFQVDVAVQAEGLARRAKRLVVIDMDSTLIRDEVIDLLAEAAGVGDRVRTITRQAMEGHLDFAEALNERVGLLAGMPIEAVEAVADAIRLTPGARTFARTLHRLGYRIAVVSGGFDVFTERVRNDLGLDYAFANRLEVADGRLTGRVSGEIIDGAGKARILEEIAATEGVALEQTVAVGDGSNDLAMLSRAGLGIAFNAKPVVDAAADTTLKVPYLDAILFVLGIRRDDIEAADRSDG